MKTTASAGWAVALQRAWMRRGPLAWALTPLALLFGAVTALRRLAYRIGLMHTVQLARPVVVVGNLIAGGAGKTPTVLAVVALLRRAGYVPGIVSRGYGRQGDGVLEVEADTAVAQAGDEPLLLRLRSGAPVVVGRDRVAAARTLLQRHPEVDAIVSDDGLQHLALGRQAQVLVFDERGAGNGWLLPAGPLRESLPARVPPRTVVLYNAERPTTALPGHVAGRKLAGVVSLERWRAGDPPSQSALQALRGRKPTAAAGVASPDRYFAMLRAAGLDDLVPLPLPDHYDYAPPLPWPAGAADVVVTEKDAVKLDPARTGATRIWVAPLDFSPGDAFEQALLALLPPAAASGNRDGSPPA